MLLPALKQIQVHTQPMGHQVPQSHQIRRIRYILGRFHAPRGMIEFWIDPESPYHKEIFAQEGKKYVFHCASGWRSALTVATLQDMGFEAAHLEEGCST